MRAGLSTIQQTLTPEAASVLNQSIAEAGRRNHGQTTPLHVAATLLASPSGFLRQACIKSHPNSSHPLQCRALELCFSVALERLPTAQNMNPGMEPPISNALMAALKRSQAHQRRGCPEQQQQPLLAVKVELEQLIISILDDPSVSRVMHEARFSSPAVKAIIEQSLNSSPSVAASTVPAPIGYGFRPAAAATVMLPGRNLYMNPRLQQPQGSQNGVTSEVKKVVDILLRDKKRNPVLVGDSEPEAVIKEVVRRIENRELSEGLLQKVEIVHLEKEFSSDRTQILGKVKELGGFVENQMAKSNGGGIILNLGDLKWLVEQTVSSNGVPGSGSLQPQPVVSEAGRVAVAEIGRLLMRFGEDCSGRFWMIGTATCETYLRCQVYHPSMESDWDLQAVPIAARAPLPGLFPRLGTNGILSNSIESMSPLKSFLGALKRPTENSVSAQRATCCSQCKQNCEQELAKVVATESEKSSSNAKSKEPRPPLPQWLQNAKVLGDVKTSNQAQNKDQELNIKQKTQELQKKWSEMCLRLHPSFHQHTLNCEGMASSPISMTGLYNTNLLGRQPIQSNLQTNKKFGESLQLNSNPIPSQPSRKTVSPPESPVGTDLGLGQTKFIQRSIEQTHNERIKDFMGCIPSEPQTNVPERHIDVKQPFQLDADSFKKLFKGLLEKVWWQKEAATTVAATTTQCKLGNGKKRGIASKGDIWLLFLGPDRVGKKKMGLALSELVSGSSPVMISLGSQHGDGESGVSFRGKTVLDRIAEVVRRNPFSVIMLEGINEADSLVCGSIKRAIEKGRIADSHGREFSLGNVIFILTADWLPDDLKNLANGSSLDEEKLARIATGGWQLKLSLFERTEKRKPNWLNDDHNHRPSKPKKETCSALAFDLNEAVDIEDYKADESHNSSDLTIEHEKEHIFNNIPSPTSSPVPCDLLDIVDEAIVFKPMDLNTIQSIITTSITKKCFPIIGEGILLEVEDDAVEKILSKTWLDGMSLEEWIEQVMVPSVQQIKSRFSCTARAMRKDSIVLRLEQDCDSDNQSCGELLPNSIKVVVADAL